ncbi:MAG: SIMPL domain-containing protein [Undibacterium sp.]
MFQENTQQSVKSLAWLLIAVAALLGAVEFGRSVDKTYPTRTFTVDGEGTVEIVPDVAKFSVSVVSDQGKDVATVQKANSEKMAAVNAFLKESGVSEKDLKTEEYTLSPRYDYPNCVGISPCPQPTIAGYTLTQTLRVTVRDKEKIGDLLSGVVAKGGNSVSQVVFTVDDEEDTKTEARKKAIETAEKKAARIAKDAGFRMGRLVSIYETPQMIGYGGAAEADAYSMKSAVANPVPAPSVEPGTNETKVTVSLTYEIR